MGEEAKKGLLTAYEAVMKAEEEGEDHDPENIDTLMKAMGQFYDEEKGTGEEPEGAEMAPEGDEEEEEVRHKSSEGRKKSSEGKKKAAEGRKKAAETEDESEDEAEEEEAMCGECEGEGETDGELCPVCKGTGLKPVSYEDEEEDEAYASEGRKKAAEGWERASENEDEEDKMPLAVEDEDEEEEEAESEAGRKKAAEAMAILWRKNPQQARMIEGYQRSLKLQLKKAKIRESARQVMRESIESRLIKPGDITIKELRRAGSETAMRRVIRERVRILEAASRRISQNFPSYYAPLISKKAINGGSGFSSLLKESGIPTVNKKK